MNQILKKDADKIIKASIAAVMPDEAVHKALKEFDPGTGKIVLIAAGKAAWQMANAARKSLDRIDAGIVITKYGHVMGHLEGIDCYEAGHPVPDENSFESTRKAIDMVSGLSEKDTVLFLLSGGGSALFEMPLVSGEELQDITKQLLACGADIVEINTIRKRLSAVKGGKFAQIAYPARVYTIVLSDILGDPLDMIASGPAYPDSSSCDDAKAIVKKYDLKLDEEAEKLLEIETPKELSNVETHVTGSVRELVRACAKASKELGYEPFILTDEMSCMAKEAGCFLASIAKTHASDGRKSAYIAGGETIVHLTGSGKGGRNQELALSAAEGIKGVENVAVFSVGSDGTDGPTDAAGGYVDGDTYFALEKEGISIPETLRNNDAYTALKAADGLIVTGPTGTNVNDVAVVLIN